MTGRMIGGGDGRTTLLFGELQIGGWPRIQKPEFSSHDGERNHKGLPARKSASLVRKKSETRIETEETTTA